MDGYSDVLGKTRILADAYQKINDEGRDILDKVLQKLLEGAGNSKSSDLIGVASYGDTAFGITQGQ